MPYTIQSAGPGAFIRPVERHETAAAAIGRARTLARHNLTQVRAGLEPAMCFGVYETDSGRCIYTIEETPYYQSVTGGIQYI